MVRYVSPPSGSPASKLAPAPSGGDDLAALQAFVDATNAGDIVTFRGDGAVYLVSGTLALPASRTYRGGGWVSSVGTTIKLMDGANADAVVAAAAWVNDSVTIGQALTIEGLRIDGNAAGQSSGNGDGLVLMNWRSTVERVAVDNARRHGIRLTVLGASGGVVSNQAAENSIARCSVSSAGGHGIFAEDSGGKLTDGWVLDCIVAGAALDGIRVERAAGWKIRGNHVYGTIGNHGIFSQNNFATVITENYVENFGTTDNAGIYNGIFARNCMAGQATTVTDNQIKCLQTGGTNLSLIHI